MSMIQKLLGYEKKGEPYEIRMPTRDQLEQLQARVQNASIPSLVLAGAFSGKTTLVESLVWNFTHVLLVDRSRYFAAYWGHHFNNYVLTSNEHDPVKLDRPTMIIGESQILGGTFSLPYGAHALFIVENFITSDPVGDLMFLDTLNELYPYDSARGHNKIVAIDTPTIDWVGPVHIVGLDPLGGYDPRLPLRLRVNRLAHLMDGWAVEICPTWKLWPDFNQEIFQDELNDNRRGVRFNCFSQLA